MCFGRWCLSFRRPFSSKEAVMAGRVFLLPVDFSLEGYKTVFKTNEVLIGYRNTIFLHICGNAYKHFAHNDGGISAVTA
ncbi:MAG: hypothetical protein L6V93_04930 [Clostridiales bacterium]|nr:MAG: hypothetical protein L6V93_04930 [Clostridiales bacterium]